jgi:hypothetical protein
MLEAINAAIRAIIKPARNLGVASFVSRGAGVAQIARRPAALGWRSGYGGRHTATSEHSGP